LSVSIVTGRFLFGLVGAYGTFANRGVHVDPIFVTRIEDRHGNVLANFTSPSQYAISEQSAYTMLGMLKRVVNAGTAGRIRALGLKADMGGKTGTSQKNSDAWFVGVTPKLVAGGLGRRRGPEHPSVVRRRGIADRAAHFRQFHEKGLRRFEARHNGKGSVPDSGQ